MALFPAYASGDADINIPEEATTGGGVASDSDGEPVPRAVRASSPPRPYYVDVRQELGNLAVSTLYYPGRPQYRRREWRVERRQKGKESRARRYYEAVPAEDSRAEELAARAGSFLRALSDNPGDESLWLQYIEFEEACREGEASLRAAERAAAALPESRALRAALHRARVRILPPTRLLAVLRDAVVVVLPADRPHLESWLRLLATLATTATLDEVAATAAGALARLRRLPAAYPHVLYAYGAFLRDAGLWERLVLLVELVAAMNYPAGGFPPNAPDPALAARLDHDLADFEDKVIASGLPLNTVWVRVERARAAVHWRPASAGDTDPDPQRRALTADVADLLLPVADPDAAFLLSVQLLRLVKVPLFPSAEYVYRAATAAGLTEEELGASWQASSAEAMLPLVRAARRLPAAHPARPYCAATASVLFACLVDPPHYFTDRTGYLSWVNALWEASCEWATGERRLALLCWRLRWLHALLMLVDVEAEGGAAEVRRIVLEGRGAVRRHVGGAAVAYALFARIHLVAVGAERARQTALQALRAALNDPECPIVHRLYVARVTVELAGDLGAWPVVCAVLGGSLPTQTAGPPDTNVMRRAASLCEERCAALESSWAAGRAGPAGAGLCAALLPCAAEWAAARLALAPPTQSRLLLRELLHQRSSAPGAAAAEELRYLEQSACGLVCGAARDHQLVQRARSLAPHFPYSGLLALASSGATLCAWETRGEGAAPAHRLRALTAPARTHSAALAHLLPSLWRAVAAAWHPREAERVRRTCARASRLGCGGALLQVVALEAEAQAAAGRTERVLLPALDRLPNNKWLYVRGAAQCAREAAALPDLLLERQLRLHALHEELAPKPVPKASAPCV